MEITAGHREMLQHGLNMLCASRDEKSHPALSITGPWVRQELSLAPYCQTMLVFHLNNLFLPKEIILLEKNTIAKAGFSSPGGPHVCHADHKATAGFLNSKPFSSKHKPGQCWHTVLL